MSIIKPWTNIRTSITQAQTNSHCTPRLDPIDSKFSLPGQIRRYYHWRGQGGGTRLWSWSWRCNRRGGSGGGRGDSRRDRRRRWSPRTWARPGHPPGLDWTLPPAEDQSEAWMSLIDQWEACAILKAWMSLIDQWETCVILKVWMSLIDQ